MVSRLADLFEDRFSVRPETTEAAARYLRLLLAAIAFALCCTVIIALDDIFLRFNSTTNLGIGRVPTEDIIAREEGSFLSAILTAQERTNVLAQVPTVYTPADPSVARRQRDLSEKILNFIDNARADSFASLDQQVADIQAITSLQLDDNRSVIEAILQMPDDRWTQVRNEIGLVLERMMSDEIRASDLERAREQLPNQVSLRLTEQESQIVTEITSDLLRANTFENPDQTAINQAEALALVEDQQRQFVTGQIVAPAGQRIDALSFEALQELGLLAQTSNRGPRVLRALAASALVTLMLGLYISRFQPHMLTDKSQNLLLVAILFLVALAMMRAFGSANIYLMPAAALGIIYVAISTPNLAIIAAIGFAFLSSLLSRSPSLEIAALVAAGNISAILTLKNAGRLNNYFLAGLFVGMANTAVVSIFALQIGFQASDASNMLQALFSGLLIVPTAAFGLMYVLTIALNLATPFRLMDLSQPNKPLLQRLLREAPGTYQHSLQVANLAEQAAEAIGADTQMTHVAALYHDIGKMSNPFFFTENQQHIPNPHDALDDPYRSADIIINHVVEGDQIARKFNLPNRIREFIREHHGTTQVYVFYQRALKANGDENGVDPTDFSYPGPIPQSRETAILMMADSCESAARAVKPQTNQEISALVRNIIEGKRKSGQLDNSNLTLNELRKIEETFIDIFRGLFHPRLDYDQAAQRAPRPRPRGENGAPKGKAAATEPFKPPSRPTTREHPAVASPPPVERANAASATGAGNAHLTEPQPSPPETTAEPILIEDDEPLADVPVLPKRNGNKSPSKAPVKRAGNSE